MDNLTGRQRSNCMSRIRSRNTKPEHAVRKVLTSFGFKYRLHSSKLPGKPDIVIPSRKTAVFINGCFWHQHKGCKRKSMPKTNAEYWKPKLENNSKRQNEQIREIKKLGFKPLILWECETNDLASLTSKLRAILA